MNKIVSPGFSHLPFLKLPHRAFAEIEWNNGRLSIHGVIGPKANGDCFGSCGQCIDEIREVEPADGWDAEMVEAFCDIWDRWHLNDMHPYCKHLRDLGWHIKALEPLESDGAKTRGWVRYEKDRRGILCKPCPICGYEYGTAWLKEDVPQEVIDWLFNLPDSKVDPAWV